MQMRGVTYNWKVAEFPERNFKEGTEYGFIAQDVEAIFPELVNTDEDGFKSVEYNKVAPILVEALKEQQAIIDAQQEEINALNAQVAELAELILEKKDSEEAASEVSEKK
jgi:hypothetical protein